MYRGKHLEHYVGPVWVEEHAGHVGVLLRWGYVGDYERPMFLVLVDGVAAWMTSERSMALGAMKPGRALRVDVLALSEFEASVMNWGGYITVAEQGARLELRWAKVSLGANPDFSAYRVYWSDDGTDPVTLLAELVGANQTVYVTPELADGVTYKFRMTLVDLYGNESAFGATVTGAINSRPEAVAEAAVVYSEAARTATVTATLPESQDADVVEYRLYSNMIPGVGFQDKIVDWEWSGWTGWMGWTGWTMHEGVDGDPDTISIETPELAAGVWKFAVAAVDGSGLESEPVEVGLTLVMDGEDLVEVAAAPAAPEKVTAETRAGGVVRVAIRLASAEGVAQINVYRDGVLDGHVDGVEGTLEYTYDTAALEDGWYEFEARAANGDGLESGAAGPVRGMADGTAPSGELGMAVRMVA